MKKFVYLIVFILLIFTAGCTSKEEAIFFPNPWTYCQDNLKQAAEVAGFEFPLILSNFEVNAMKDMIEIKYPLDELRNVIVRKSYKEYNHGDISGVYNIYPLNQEITLQDGAKVNIRGNENKINIIYFKGKNGAYYSGYCKRGMSLNEAQGIYTLIKEVEKI